MANLDLSDFATISADHFSIATAQERLALQMRLVSNLPVVEEGNRVIKALNGVTRKLNENTKQLAAFRRTTENQLTEINVHLLRVANTLEGQVRLRMQYLKQ